MMNTDELLARTADGVEAFEASITHAFNEPERLGFVLAHDAGFVAQLAGWKVGRWIQPAVLTMLIGTVARSAQPGRPAQLLALVAGGGVDWAKAHDVTDAPSWASALAGLRYVGYGAAIKQRFDARPRTVSAAVRGLLVAAGTAVAARRNPRVAWATAIGGAAMVYATEVANDPGIRRNGSLAAQGISHGANLMMAGEALGLLRATYLRDGWRARLATAGMFSLTSLGQLLIVDGLNR